jgi:hypothetical protein
LQFRASALVLPLHPMSRMETIDVGELDLVTGGAAFNWRELRRTTLHGATTGAFGGGLSAAIAGGAAIPGVGAAPGWVVGAATGGLIGGTTSALDDVGTQLHWW